jgi:D-alanyl-D-alanine carboxypeptidase (penicillin-binding protein 5/6)
MKITYNGPLQAPIAKGAQIARLEVKMGQDAPIVLPLVAGADVPAGGWVERFMQGFRRFFA